MFQMVCHHLYELTVSILGACTSGFTIFLSSYLKASFRGNLQKMISDSLSYSYLSSTEEFKKFSRKGDEDGYDVGSNDGESDTEEQLEEETVADVMHLANDDDGADFLDIIDPDHV